MPIDQRRYEQEVDALNYREDYFREKQIRDSLGVQLPIAGPDYIDGLRRERELADRRAGHY
jgi:hypothetical protein